MRIVKIGDPDDAVLFRKAEPVAAVDRAIRFLMNGLLDTMRKQKGKEGQQTAIGLSAPQVGVSLRIIAVGGAAGSPFALANPEIVWRSEKSALAVEGCLSLPGKRVPVMRSAEVVVMGLDKRGREFKIRASGLLSAALQHEIDHCDGILITDRAVRIEPEKTDVPADAEPATARE